MDPLRPRGVRNVVAVASSAGGLKALGAFVSGLPASLPAAVLVVQHLDPHYPTLLPQILARRTSLSVTLAEDGDRLEAGVVAVAPPDRHLVVKGGRLSLSSADRVHYLRPSADLLFGSVAAAFAERAIAVILSGTGSDGTDGAERVKALGGTVICQDEASSEFPGMPRSAVESGWVDQVLPLDDIADHVVGLLGESAT